MLKVLSGQMEATEVRSGRTKEPVIGRLAISFGYHSVHSVILCCGLALHVAGRVPALQN